MRVIILAAGKGVRLSQDNRPKCLLEVEGRVLLDYMLHPLLACQPDRVTLCLGYQGYLIRAFVERMNYHLCIDWVENPAYETTNNSYTLALALADEDLRDLLIVNGDNILDSRILGLLAAARKSTLPYVVKPSYDEEDMKILYRADRENSYLVRIGKDIPLEAARGESIGARRFTEPFSEAFAVELKNLTSSDWGKKRFFTDAVQRTVELGYDLAVVDVSRFHYAEIDFDHDLLAAGSVAAAINRLEPRN